MKILSKLTVSGLVVLLLAFFLLPGAAMSQNVQNFKITSFSADYYLARETATKASTLKIEEEIVAEFPDFDQNRGILRAIPMSYNGHTLSLRVLGVTDGNGQPRTYQTYEESGNLVLRIGDVSKYVRGKQIYKISYLMRNTVALFDGHDEFYWDINGDQWQQKFDKVTARLHVSKEIAGALQASQKCFSGSFGMNSEACTISRATSGSSDYPVVITASAANLARRQTLTIVAGFSEGTFQLGPEIAAEKRQRNLRLLAIGAALTLPPIITGALLLKRWNKYGKDPRGRGIIVPEYVPPDNFNVLSSSVILSEKLENTAVSAFVVECAVNGYVSISEIQKKGLFGKKDYELEVIKDTSPLGDIEQDALKMFFAGGVTVGQKTKLSSLKNSLNDDVKALDKKLTGNLHASGYFRGDPHKTRGYYMAAGIAALVVGIILIAILGQYAWMIAVGLILSSFIIMLSSKAMPARSKLGVAARDHLLGLKDYMKLAESERLKFLQSPEGAQKIQQSGLDPKNPKHKIKLFEKLLPYAILFGIEKDWAHQFKDIYTEPPDWYHGNWQTFNAVHLATSINGLTAAGAVSFASPSSSGSSGLGGGGFSGGGGGGGGGGGW